MSYPYWYSLSQFFTCSFSALIFLYLYYIGKPQRRFIKTTVRMHDKGLLYIGLAILAWAATGLILILMRVYDLGRDIVEPVRIFSSTLNSAFFLLAAAHLEYAPFKIRFMQGNRSWAVAVILTAVVIAILCASIGGLHGFKDNTFKIPDVALSLVTIVVLALITVISFFRRKLGFLALISALVFVVLSWAQILELADLLSGEPVSAPTEVQLALNLCAKLLFLTVMFALVISHYREMLENPDAHKYHLRLYCEADQNESESKSKHYYWVDLTIGFDGVQEATVNAPTEGSYSTEQTDPIQFKRKLPKVKFSNLLMFCLVRMAQGDSSGWVHLESFRLPSNTIKLISDELGLESHRLLFENNQRGAYRLLVSGRNISVERSLLDSPLYQEISGRVNETMKEIASKRKLSHHS